MTKLLYQGHGSFRIISNNGTVIYFDPYIKQGCEYPADYIIVTHEHGDHNKIELIPKKENCRVLRAKDFIIEDGSYRIYEFENVSFQGTQAYNAKHDIKECVGCIIQLDGIKIYGAGDTSLTNEMKTMASLKLDYVLLPCDGIYNMNVVEASQCANLINGKHSIPIHMKPGVLFDQEIADAFNGVHKLVIKPLEEIELNK